MKENVIQNKSYLFAIRIVKLHLFLSKQREYELSAQILRSGTSIGANVEEAIGGYSKKDFSHKLSVAYKEARETKYWIRLLRDSGIVKQKLADSFLADCEEILAILFTILRSSKT